MLLRRPWRDIRWSGSSYSDFDDEKIDKVWKANVISDTTKKTTKVKEGEVEVVDPIGDIEDIE